MPRPPSFDDLDAALEALGEEARNDKPRRLFLKELSEARRLHRVARSRRERFAALADFDLAALDRLPEIIERAERASLEESGTRRRPSRKQARDEAIAVRSRLVAAARRALPGDESLQWRLTGMYRRRTLSQIVNDLDRLAGLVEKNAEAFGIIPGLPERPALVARDLVSRLVGARNPAHDEAEARRNALFALLALAVREVRCAGRYLFRHEPELLAGFTDRTRRTDRRRRAGKKDDGE